MNQPTAVVWRTGPSSTSDPSSTWLLFIAFLWVPAQWLIIIGLNFGLGRAWWTVLTVVTGGAALVTSTLARRIRRRRGRLIQRLGEAPSPRRRELIHAARVSGGSLVLVGLIAMPTSLPLWLLAGTIVRDILRISAGPALHEHGVAADRFIPWDQIRAHERGRHGERRYLILHLRSGQDDALPEVGILVERGRQHQVERILRNHLPA